MNRNVLLVEYDESTIHVLKELLSHPEIDLTVVSDGESALRILGKKTFDMMITAAMLPRFHGFKLCQDVIAQYPNCTVVIISAIYKGLQYRHMALTQYKAADFFEKPLEKERFKSRIIELLGLGEKELPKIPAPGKKHATSAETVKIPAPWNESDKEKKISSEDIFGDIIDQVEGQPAIEIKFDEKPQAFQPPAPPPSAKWTPPPPPKIAAKEIPIAGKAKIMESKEEAAKKIPAPAAEIKIAPAKEEVIELRKEDSLTEKQRRELFKAAAPIHAAARPVRMVVEKGSAALSDLELKVKTQKIAIPDILREKKTDTIPINLGDLLKRREAPSGESRLKKIEDDIMKKLDETLSGLGFPGSTKAPPKESKLLEVRREPAKPEKATDDDWDYDILGLIARGGMAEIYKAKKRGHKGFEKIIAIKKILSGYGEDDKYIEMLVDEAKVAAQLSHPNIVHIYDLKKKDNFYFIVMEYVLGKDLRIIQRVLQDKNQLLPEDIAIYIVIKVLEALNYAHKASNSEGKRLEIVHRDVSPPNILISYNGDIKLADFGISKASIKIHQTVSGALKGKLLYMSPEQAQGEENIDYRSDLYSAGLILFELITGKKQFMDRTEMGILKKVQNGQIMSPRQVNPAIDPQLDSIVIKCLHKDKERRYQNAADMIHDLQSYLLRKYNYFPSPMHLSQFMAEHFQDDIRKEGIKIEQKTLLEKAPLRKMEKVEEPKPPPPPHSILQLDLTPVSQSTPPPVAKPEPAPKPIAMPAVKVSMPPPPMPAPQSQRLTPPPVSKPSAPQPLPKPQPPPRTMPPPSPVPEPAKAAPPPPLEEKAPPPKTIVEINFDDEPAAPEIEDDLIITFGPPVGSPPEPDKRPPVDEKKPYKTKKGWFS